MAIGSKCTSRSKYTDNDVGASTSLDGQMLCYPLKVHGVNNVFSCQGRRAGQEFKSRMKTSSIYLTRNPNAINYSSPDLANKLLHYIGLNVLERTANRKRAITICYDRCQWKGNYCSKSRWHRPEAGSRRQNKPPYVEFEGDIVECFQRRFI